MKKIIASGLISLALTCLVNESKAVPPNIPSQSCSSLQFPKPGDLCHILHEGLGAKAHAGGSGIRDTFMFQPPNGAYVVVGAYHEITEHNGAAYVSKQIAASGGDYEWVSGYSRKLSELDRFTSELEGELAGVTGPLVGVARGKLAYLKERREQYAEHTRFALTASRNAETYVFPFYAVPHKCGILKMDTCGSWVFFRVWEVRRYIGDPIAEYNMRVLPIMEAAKVAVKAAVDNSNRENGVRVRVWNKCNKNVKLILKYFNNSDVWVSGGVWELNSGQDVLLTHEYGNVVSKSSIFYIYAEGDGVSWTGDIPIEYKGGVYNGRRVSLERDSNGRWFLPLTCH